MSNDAPPSAVTVEKQMSITHKEFFRILPGALAGSDYRVEGDRVVVKSENRRLEITVSGESQRRMGLLTFPVTSVRLDFIGYGKDDTASALALFDRAFQR